MSVWFYSGVAALLLSVSCWAQADSTPVKASLCDLYTHPEQFAGKMIEVRASLVGHRDPSVESPASSRQEPCSAYMGIVLEFPDKVAPRPPFDLERDAAFQKYQDALQKPMRIEATLVGRFDPVFVWKDKHRLRVGEGTGFGKKHSADARFVLRSMADVMTWYMPRR
jgi:hypothetical protein